MTLAGCKSEPPSPAPAEVRVARAPEPAPIEVRFAGCARVVLTEGAPVCALKDARKLRLWVASEDVEVIVRARSQALAAEPRPIAGGLAFDVAVPAGAEAVHLEARRTGASGTSSWRLRLAEIPVAAVLGEAHALRRKGRYDDAIARLEAALGELGPADGVRAKSMLARIERSRGNNERALALFRESIAAHEAAGRVSEASSDRFAAAFTALYGARRFEIARELLEGARDHRGHYPQVWARLPYYLGLVSFETGDLRTALELLTTSEREAERLGLASESARARSARSLVLEAMGRWAEAHALLEEELARMPAEGRDCDRAATLTSIGWVRLQAAEADRADGREPRWDPVAAFERSLASHRASCPEPDRLHNVLVNLALAELARGELTPAAARLGEARQVRPEAGPRVTAWEADVEGRIALRTGRYDEALSRYESLFELARRADLDQALWRAALGRARALDGLERVDEAAAAYQLSERLLDEQALRVPLGEGRDSFLAGRARSARLRVDFLVRRGRPREAMEAARRSRARSLAILSASDRLARLEPQERRRWDAAVSRWRAARAALSQEAASDWKLPADELAGARKARAARRAALTKALDEALAALGGKVTLQGQLRDPQPGELLLTWHPVGEGWVGLAATDAAVAARPVSLPASVEGAAEALLGPFEAEIRAAKRLRLLPYGAVRRYDLHALAFPDQAPLIATLPVAYGVDLPRGRQDVSALDKPEATLVVGDPRGDLPAARAESRSVRAALGGRAEVISLESSAATHPAVVTSLARSDLFHYAGHGEFAGRDGFSSGLPLAEGGRLDVADILALERAPDRVVLSGCETATAAADARAESLGLAQAFVVAGSGAVVAAVRPVDDRLASELSRKLYAEGPPLDMPAALRRAQLSLAGEKPQSDWATFRVLVP